MEQAFAGDSGSGSVNVYVVPPAYFLRLDTLTFTLATDATAGIHKVRLTLTDSALGAVTARLRDLNEGGPSMTLRYTYGVGLAASACEAADGWEMTDALPQTILTPQTTLNVAAVDDGGNVIAGDAISGVVLYGDLWTETTETDSTLALLPGFLPAGSEL